ncbi:MAG TPA: metal-sensing transcriptional repressor [Patescibacteria group bacterium]|nr:metal-sensing transcriptional repressor [Patescibacteria group bacterium]
MPRGVPRDISIKRKILHRLKITKGHLDRVISMVETDEYCIDVIHQSLAVQASLRETDQVILKNHMETCVADSIKKGNTKEVIDEVMKVLGKK